LFRSGVGKKGQITSNFKTDSDKLNYYIYDIITPLDENYKERYKMLVERFNQYLNDDHRKTVLRVLPVKVAKTEEEMDEMFNEAVAAGEEGIVIRKYSVKDSAGDKAKYRPGRGPRIFKRKDFTDEEAEVVDVTEGKDREKGLALLKIRDIRGNEFIIRPAETFETRKEWFKNPENVIGKQYTFRYQELSPYNVPQTISGVCLRDYEG
jgi:ATP-dependent DNA ligase